MSLKARVCISDWYKRCFENALKTAVGFTPIIFRPMFSQIDYVFLECSFVELGDVPRCFFCPWIQPSFFSVKRVWLLTKKGVQIWPMHISWGKCKKNLLGPLYKQLLPSSPLLLYANMQNFLLYYLNTFKVLT